MRTEQSLEAFLQKLALVACRSVLAKATPGMGIRLLAEPRMVEMISDSALCYYLVICAWSFLVLAAHLLRHWQGRPNCLLIESHREDRIKEPLPRLVEKGRQEMARCDLKLHLLYLVLTHAFLYSKYRSSMTLRYFVEL